MPRKATKQAKPRGLFDRVARVLTRLTGRGNGKATAIAEPKHQVRTKRTETDIPLDRIENEYTPTQTSLKGPFRTSGADRQRDQDYARGVADDRWNDEDVLTNKSGDPRIGTHGRTYEPGEAMAARGRGDDKD